MLDNREELLRNLRGVVTCFAGRRDSIGFETDAAMEKSPNFVGFDLEAQLAADSCPPLFVYWLP